MDIYGGVAVIDFARDTWRAALTADYELFRPVMCADELGTLAALGP